SAQASFPLLGPDYSATVSVNQLPGGASALDLSGLFGTTFILVNSDGTQTYRSDAQISLTGPGGISFLSSIMDSGFVPAGSGYIEAKHNTAFHFSIALTSGQQALFQGSGTTDVNVSLLNYSTTGPSSSTSFYSWDVTNGAVSAVSTVPMPASAWLMLLGIGAVGAATRRRKTA
ncbi:MAG: VPLPA-CTERM sorting domain-containing protein, partial [Burkholderiales bacterium]